MENVTLIKRLRGIQGAFSFEIVGLEDLINELIREEMCRELEPAKVNRIKAAERFAKHCKQQLLGSHPHLAGAFFEDGIQYICDNYTVVRYKNPIAGLTQAAESDRHTRMGEVFEQARGGNASLLPGFAEMKRVVAIFKAAASSKRAKHLTYVGGSYFNTEYLIRAMTLAGITSGEARYGNQKLYLANGDCEVVLLAFYPRDEDKIWYPFGQPEQPGENQE